ncbi:MAG: DegT/DnrJ/EryC1/StrS family aminotransferase [Syntrophales bacterium]|jgi:dTDP-4-amino-4,6-dideoxygalactose transaminase|nr:DegT/DnrJ/EryC1/StrS family aminotransferase [Syntrophales bacterium]
MEQSKGGNKTFVEASGHDPLQGGPEVRELESRFAQYCGVKHAVACASGADALTLALMSRGVGPGDAIFTTPFHDTTAVSAIRLLGATPIFVDIDPSTFNLDPEQLAQAIDALIKKDASIYPLPTEATGGRLELKGIISPDLFGLPADYDAINATAGEHGLFVIEDASEAFGAQYKGRYAGSLSDMAFVSFLDGTLPETGETGGLCLTDQEPLAEWMRLPKETGMPHATVGGVNHMASRQALSILTRFDALPEEIRLRRKLARLYTKYLDDNPLLVTPYVPRNVLPVWSRYSLLTESDEERSVMLKKLERAGFTTGIYYDRPLYLHDDFADLQYREGDFPVSDDYASRIFSIPLHPGLTAQEQERILDLLNDWE